MPIYKPSELNNFLTSLGVSPKKSLSQNFLIDGNIIKKIVSTAHIGPGDVVLEIGSGPGALTEELLNSGATVVAVERDTVFAKALERLQTEDKRLHIFCEDILQFSFHDHLFPILKKGQKAQLIANLPYHLTTPILINLLEYHAFFSKLVVMVQDEVGRRFTAKPGGHEYGSITLYLNFFCDLYYAFTVSKNCFYPVPKVQSAIIVLELKEPVKVSDREQFFKLTRTSFEHRRKMLRASLKELYSSEKVTEALIQLHLNPLARPEELSLENFVALFEVLN